MWMRILIGLVILIVSAGTLAYLNRTQILTHFVLKRVEAGHHPVAPHRPITWQAGPETPDLPAEDRPPNIVFILLDDLGINDISTFGGGLAKGAVRTPNIDRLAAEGAIFSQAYSGTATCAPSRAMLLTGRYPTRTGFEFTPLPDGMDRVVASIGNSVDRGELPPIGFNQETSENRVPYNLQGLPGEEVTIAEMLQDNGYHTVHIGKWHLGRSEESLPNAQGFDESLLMHSLLFLPEDDPNVVNARLDFDPIDQFL